MDTPRKRGRPRKIVEPVEVEAIQPESVVTPVEPVVTITIVIGDKTYSGQGTTVAQAMEVVPYPDSILTEAHVTISNGTKQLKKYLTTMQTRRLFFPNSQFYIAHDFERELCP